MPVYGLFKRLAAQIIKRKVNMKAIYAIFVCGAASVRLERARTPPASLAEADGFRYTPGCGSCAPCAPCDAPRDQNCYGCCAPRQCCKSDDCCGVSTSDLVGKICYLEECLADLKKAGNEPAEETCDVTVYSLYDYVSEQDLQFGGTFFASDTLNDVWAAIDRAYPNADFEDGGSRSTFELLVKYYDLEDGSPDTEDVELGSSYRTLADIKKDWGLCPG